MSKWDPPIDAHPIGNSKAKLLAPINSHSTPINRRPPSLSRVQNVPLKKASQIILKVLSQLKGFHITTPIEIK